MDERSEDASDASFTCSEPSIGAYDYWPPTTGSWPSATHHLELKDARIHSPSTFQVRGSVAFPFMIAYEACTPCKYIDRSRMPTRLS